jgi:hypothetical protein
MVFRNVAAFLALSLLAAPGLAVAAKWVPNPSQPGQWVDLDSRKHDEEVVRFNVSMSTNADTGQPSTTDDDVVIEVLNCETGKRVMIMTMLDNDTRHLPTLSQDDPLLKLVCG